MCIYDVGAVPKQIEETLSRRYILTDTRLYVLFEGKLEAIVDVFDQGKLIIADHGFGLLQPKHFRWFTPGGGALGSVQSKDPIRRVFRGQNGLTVETRSHRAVIGGAQEWW